MRPFLWSKMGAARRYILAGYLVLGLLISVLWLILQLRLTERTALTPAAEAFFGGIGLIMMLIVLGTVAGTIAVENAIISRETVVYKRIQDGRQERLEALAKVIEKYPSLTLLISQTQEEDRPAETDG